MGDFLAALVKATVALVFAAWLFILVAGPHPGRVYVAGIMCAVVIVGVWAWVGLLRDYLGPRRVDPLASTHLSLMETNMEETKPWYLSRGIGGGVVAALAGVAQLAGYTLTPADQAALIDGATQAYQLALGVGSLVGGLVAIWGRLRASKAIGVGKAA